MRNVSEAWKRAIEKDRTFVVEVTILYADGTKDTLTDLTDFMGIKVTDDCSGSSDFAIGAAIINEAVVTLNNRAGKFTEKEFYGAKIRIKVGILINGKPEYVDMGLYVVDEPVSPGISIKLTAYDQMIYLDKEYIPKIIFPATLAQIAEDACDQGDVQLQSLIFPQSDYIVETAPESGHTCREVLAAVAQLSGCFARVDGSGQIEIAWYNETVDKDLSGIRSRTTTTDDVIITGIEVQTGQESISAGEDGYKLAIKDNLLLESGKEQETAEYLAKKLVGMRFRPLTVTCTSDPALEAGDLIRVTDETGATYTAPVTSTTFEMHAAQKVACKAASPAVNSSRRGPSDTAAIVKAKKYTDEKMRDEENARNTAVKNLANQIATAGGMYVTEEQQEDESFIYYIHNKPQKEESAVLLKLTDAGLGLSKDGGKTWPYGFDFSGDAILNKIYAIGINADYINTGSFVIKNDAGRVIMSANADTGKVFFNADEVTFADGETVTNYIGSHTITKEEAQTMANEAESNAREYANESAADLTNRIESAEQATKDVASDIAENYVNKNQMGDYSQSIQAAAAQQASEMLNNALEDTQKALNSMHESMNDTAARLQELRNQIKVKNGTIIMYGIDPASGELSTDAIFMVLDRGKMGFYQGDPILMMDDDTSNDLLPIAWFGNQNFNINAGTIVKSLRIGNFMWQTRENGHLSLVVIGEGGTDAK